MNRIVKLIVSSVLMSILIGGSVCAFDIPEEPTPFWSEAIHIWIVPVKNAIYLMASFDLNKNGEENYQTQRRILPNFKIEPYPSYYYINLDGNKAVNLETECWVDVPPDGDTSNVIPYLEYQKMQQKLADEQPTDYSQLLEGAFK